MGRQLAAVGAALPKGPRAASIFGVVAGLFASSGVAACARPAEHAQAAATKVRLPPLGSAATPPGATGIPWSAKTGEQRMEYMGLVFHPRMRELFQKSDPAAYDKFRCQTCHGEDMVQRRFHMPASLRALPATDSVPAARARNARATDFMIAEVMPVTVDLLGAGDPETEARLGCSTCHGTE